MEIILSVIGIGVLLGLAYLIFRLKDLKQPDNENTHKLMFEYIDSLRKEMRDRGESMDAKLAKGLESSQQTIQKQFAESARVIKDVTEQLTHLRETNQQVKDFASQMQSLENILKNPKQRGILGEYFLESLLGHVLQPNQYQMQYKFDNGEIVDAAIFFKDKIIPIDAKFSLEKYNQIMEEQDKDRRDKLEKEFKGDVKNRIDETSKYIRPEDNTTDFAFMFIPAEGIYYNLLIYRENQVNVNSADLIEYAFKKHVIIVSPTSFYAYLETVLQGLKALQMEESVKDIIKKVGELGKHMGSYETYMQKMGSNLSTTVNMYNSAYREFRKIDKDVYKITDGETGGKVDPLLVDKPNLEA